METTVKINVEKLREDIKILASKQIYLKDQRKTVNIKNERKMEPWRATMDHYHNRKELSVMYAALLVLRGWSEDEAANAHISKKDESWSFDSMKKKIQEVLDKYKEDEE